MLKLEVLADVARPGELMRCEVSISETRQVQQIFVDMIAVESTDVTFVNDYERRRVLRQVIATEGTAYAGTSIPFEFIVPKGAVQAFSTRRTALRWELAATAVTLGGNETCATPLSLLPPSDVVAAEIAPAAIERQASKETQRAGDRGVAGLFIAVIVLICIVGGIWLATNPPPDGNRIPGISFVGAGLLFSLVFLGTTAARRREMRQSTLTVHGPQHFLQPDEFCDAHIGSPRPGTVVQLVAVENFTEQNPRLVIEELTTEESRSQMHELISLQSIDLDLTTTAVRFQIAPDAPATYLGEIIQVEHWLQIVPTRRARKDKPQVDVLAQCPVLVGQAVRNRTAD